MTTARFVDLSHTVEHDMVTYPGLPPPRISDHLTREASRANYVSGTEFHVGRIEMVANTGTYLDTPLRRYPDGDDLAALPGIRREPALGGRARSFSSRPGCRGPSCTCAICSAGVADTEFALWVGPLVYGGWLVWGLVLGMALSRYQRLTGLPATTEPN